MPYQLSFSPVFKITLQRLCSFLNRKYSSKLADNTLLSIRKHIKQRLPEDPCIGPVCDRLLELGVSGYRQLTIDNHNIVIYRVDEEQQKIIILAAMDSRQSIEKLLHEVILLM